MLFKKFILWKKRIHLLTIDENIHCQYEQKVFIISDLVRTQKPRQIQITFLVCIVFTFLTLGQLNLRSHWAIFQHLFLDSVIPTLRTNPSNKRTLVVHPMVFNPS